MDNVVQRTVYTIRFFCDFVNSIGLFLINFIILALCSQKNDLYVNVLSTDFVIYTQSYPHFSIYTLLITVDNSVEEYFYCG